EEDRPDAHRVRVAVAEALHPMPPRSWRSAPAPLTGPSVPDAGVGAAPEAATEPRPVTHGLFTVTTPAIDPHGITWLSHSPYRLALNSRLAASSSPPSAWSSTGSFTATSSVSARRLPTMRSIWAWLLSSSEPRLAEKSPRSVTAW